MRKRDRWYCTKCQIWMQGTEDKCARCGDTNPMDKEIIKAFARMAKIDTAKLDALK